jgi:hypothetical protein
MIDKILITSDTRLAKYAQACGIERIMVDLEVLGKEGRQGHLKAVFSKHTFEDIKNIRAVLDNSKLLVRINPINKTSKKEIDKVIDLGADIVMLPMFKTVQEVKKFMEFVGGKITTCLLLETSQAMVRVDDILEVDGINEIHIGLNDLHLALGTDFMFELLSGGIVEYLSEKILKKGISFGFGGVARVGRGMLDAKLILSEHYRLNSSRVILSRDFKGYVDKYEEIVRNIDLECEVKKIDDYMESLNEAYDDELEKNRLMLKDNVNMIVREIVSNFDK